MQNNICSNWQDVKEWIEDNKLQRYSFRTEKQADRSNCVIFAYDTQDTPEENLRLCEKRLAAATGQHLYGTGFRTQTANTGGLYVEVLYTGAQMPVYGVGAGMIGALAPIDEEALSSRIRKEIKQEMELESLRKREKDIEAREKEYEAQKASVLGGIFSYLAPYIPQILGANTMANVAGAGGPVQAERIVPTEPATATDTEEAEAVNPDDLPDEEAQKVYELIKRFRKVEPDYLSLIESVVKMAESGDAMYGAAKSFLVKK